MSVKNNFLWYLVLGILVVLDVCAASTIRLGGVGNFFEPLRTDPALMPAVRITKRGVMVGNKPSAQGANIFINPQPYRGQLQPVDLPLIPGFPIEVEVRFRAYNAGQPYIIVIEHVTNPNDMIACQGASMATVRASIKGSTANEQKICVPLTWSVMPTSACPIHSGDFNNVAFFVGPLAAHESYDARDVRSLPFSFGLMKWTASTAPWNNRALSSFDMVSDKETEASMTSGKSLRVPRTVNFTHQPLDVLQGFAALGSDLIPRPYHLSIGHIFNDSDSIVILSRESSQPELAPFNITQIIPPSSILPYALVWVPKVPNKEELSFPGHDGIRIAALQKPETARAPGVISHSDITELGPRNIAGIPKGLKDLDAIIAESLNNSVPTTAANLLGVTLWNKEMEISYKNFEAAGHYFVIATDGSTNDTYLQKYNVRGDVLIGGTQKLDLPAAYGTGGNPHFCNIVITKDKSKKESFDITVYPVSLRAPRRR